MFRRCIGRASLETQCLSSSLPPTFLLPLRARLSTISQHIEPSPPPPTLQAAKRYSKHPTQSSQLPKAAPILPLATPCPPTPDPQAISIPNETISPSIRTLLPLLRAQPSHYITAHIHSRPYLLTEGDSVRLPFHMPDVKPGDILRLNRASTIGSRDYTLRGAPYLDERLFECRATVIGVEAEPMRLLEKTKRRNRKIKIVKSKHRFTVLRVREVRVRSLEEVEGGGVGSEVLGDVEVGVETA